MNIESRPYQTEAIEAVKVNLPLLRHQLIELPTGTGKTILFIKLINDLCDDGGRALILAHRHELIEQAVEKYKMVIPDADIGVIKAERNELGHQITVASVQSLHKNRLEHLTGIGEFNYKIVVTDEAHHAYADSYKEIYRAAGIMERVGAHWVKRNADDTPIHIGVTATPTRTNKSEGLGVVYDKVAYSRDILEFMPEYLCDLRIMRRQSGINLNGVRATAGDFNCNELGDLLNTDEGNSMVVDFWMDFAQGRNRTLAFCADIAHVHGLADAFADAGIPAAGIDSNMGMQERKDILRMFRDGEIKVLANCGILTEGFDMPELDCIVLARPTTSELLLRQMIGRGTRIFPEKDDCLILDVACVSEEWDVVTPTNLFGLRDETADGERTVRELSTMPRARLAANELEFEKAIEGVFETRKVDNLSPGKLAWVNNRWFGYTLSTSKRGRIRIVINEDMQAYSAYHIYEHEDGKIQKKDIATSVELDTAFTMAESYLRTHAPAKLQGMLSSRTAWRRSGEPATKRQIYAIKRMGGIAYLKYDADGKINTSKDEASRLISFLYDK